MDTHAFYNYLSPDLTVRSSHWQLNLSYMYSMARLLRIDTDLLIPGRGLPLKQATCVFQANRIEWVGLQSELSRCHKGIVPASEVAVLIPPVGLSCSFPRRNVRRGRRFHFYSPSTG